MPEPVTVTVIVAPEILKQLVDKAVDKIVAALRKEIARIRHLIEANTLADLYAALDQTESALTLQDNENRKLHLNLSIAEFNKAIRRLEANVSATPDRLLARFGKAVAYNMLNERDNARKEFQRLTSDVDAFIEEVRQFHRRDTEGRISDVFKIFLLPRAIYLAISLTDAQKAVSGRMLQHFHDTKTEDNHFGISLLHYEKTAWLDWWDLATNLRSIATTMT
jgi:tetratricopeptide (TPR) repeat protein